MSVQNQIAQIQNRIAAEKPQVSDAMFGPQVISDAEKVTRLKRDLLALAAIADAVRVAYESSDKFQGAYDMTNPVEAALGELTVALANVSAEVEQ